MVAFVFGSLVERTWWGLSDVYISLKRHDAGRQACTFRLERCSFMRKQILLRTRAFPPLPFGPPFLWYPRQARKPPTFCQPERWTTRSSFGDEGSQNRRLCHAVILAFFPPRSPPSAAMMITDLKEG